MTPPDTTAPAEARPDPVPPSGEQLRVLTHEAMRRRSQSPLHRWLDSIHDTLMAEGGRLADWTLLCAAAREAGLVDGRGQPPTPRRMSRLWQKIRRQRAKTPPRKPAGPTEPPAPSSDGPAAVVPLPRTDPIVPDPRGKAIPDGQPGSLGFMIEQMRAESRKRGPF